MARSILEDRLPSTDCKSIVSLKRIGAGQNWGIFRTLPLLDDPVGSLGQGGHDANVTALLDPLLRGASAAHSLLQKWISNKSAQDLSS